MMFSAPFLFGLCFASLVVFCAAHSAMMDPQNTSPWTCRMGGEPQFGVDNCPGPCDRRAIDGGYSNHGSSDNPAAVYARGEKVTVKYQRNNHGPGGFIKMSLVPADDMMNVTKHNENAFHYTCWGGHPVEAKPSELDRDPNGYSFVGSDGEQHEFSKGYYTIDIRIPNVVPDGDYILRMVWYGGIGNRVKGNFPQEPTKYGYFGDYHSCSFVRVEGGSLENEYQPIFVNDMEQFSEDGCMAANDRPGVCVYEPCKVDGSYQKPAEFKDNMMPKPLTPANFNGVVPGALSTPTASPSSSQSSFPTPLPTESASATTSPMEMTPTALPSSSASPSSAMSITSMPTMTMMPSASQSAPVMFPKPSVSQSPSTLMSSMPSMTMAPVQSLSSMEPMTATPTETPSASPSMTSMLPDVSSSPAISESMTSMASAMPSESTSSFMSMSANPTQLPIASVSTTSISTMTPSVSSTPSMSMSLHPLETVSPMPSSFDAMDMTALPSMSPSMSVPMITSFSEQMTSTASPSPAMNTDASPVKSASPSTNTDAMGKDMKRKTKMMALSCYCIHYGKRCSTRLAEHTEGECKPKISYKKQPANCQQACCGFCEQDSPYRLCKSRRVMRMCQNYW